MMTFNRYSLFMGIVVFIQVQVSAQVMHGKITYERKTNLFKKYKDDDGMKEWIREENKNKVDVFELYFNDSISVFMPQESDLRENFSWTTSKNTVYQNFKRNKQLSVKTLWEEKMFMEDSITKKEWKITTNKRTIAGYSCRKAIWYMNDSTPIYAWYTNEIIPSVGPETFCKLPGAILGLATEDGGVIYFAKSVETSATDVQRVIPRKGKNKIYTTSELKAKLEKDYGKNTWGKAMIKEMFSW
ncbi:MAG TPA: GLPGLI family protein [Bacteroidia bacterium]|nr:GLPGLI family protein [Bacteroidia bacterium]HRG53225.1 GLPGLI family protein [Bacteroidia bacterium]